MQRFHFLLNFLFSFLFLAGCAGPPERSIERETAPKSATATEPPRRVSDRAGNTSGGVIIVEYHKIARQEARWDRSTDRFRKDLERFYKLGFRPVTLGAYVSGKMDLPRGASPVVFTFDDSHPSQFKLLEDGSLDPECALGIWHEFAEKHSDFPIRATFFILPNTGPWGQPDFAREKFKLLKDWGCEVGSHTLTHANLKKIPPPQIEKELAGACAYVRSHGFDPFAIALPYGISPKDAALLKRFHRAALLVGAGPAPAPGSPKLDPMRLPRIQGIDGDYGITFWLDKAEKGSFKPYVQP